jgi:hypothetical protein
MAEQFLAIVLLFILLSLFFSVRSERYKEELAKTISDSAETARVLEALIQDTYHLTINEALEEIQRLKSNLMRVIVWLSRDLE